MSVRVETDGAVGRITLDAPEQLNSVSAEMLDALTAAVEAFAADPAVRVVVLTRAGRGLSPGGRLGRDASGRAGVDPQTLYAGGRAVRAMFACPKPVVSVVQGIAAGIGVSLALAADYCLASDEAAFMLAFSKIGLLPDGGATALVAASIGRARALRMALTAEKVPAATAYEWGLVAECVPAADLAGRAEELVAGFATGATLSYAETKAAVNAASVDLAAALGREEPAQVRLIRSADAAEGIAAFVEKRAAHFTGT